MQEEIRSNLDNPEQLERLYRADKSSFKRAFNSLYSEFKENSLVTFWNERLNFAKEEVTRTSPKHLIVVIIGAVLAGVIAKIPAFIPISEDFFYPRNIGFIVFPVLTAYFAWRNKLPMGKLVFIIGATLVSILFINLLPNNDSSDTLILSCIHLLLFLWTILGFAFAGSGNNTIEKRLGFLRFNGDLIVITTLMLIAGGILSGLTIGLFSLIGMNIETFYFNYIVIFGLAAAPIIGTYLTQTNPQLVSKISPVIARIFSPLVLIMLVTYLIAMIYSGKDPYNDREFLLIFNGMLIGVMALIFFSVAETRNSTKSRSEIWVLMLLSIITVIINCVALSAILFRISEWGFTPNRAAVMGGNVLILINLLLVTWQLFNVLTKKANLNVVGKAIAHFIPIYFIWTIIVTFIFPLIFGFK